MPRPFANVSEELGPWDRGSRERRGSLPQDQESLSPPPAVWRGSKASYEEAPRVRSLQRTLRHLPQSFRNFATWVYQRCGATGPGPASARERQRSTSFCALAKVCAQGYLWLSSLAVGVSFALKPKTDEERS